MAAKVHAEEVEDLALVKIGRRPHRRDAVERGVLAIQPDDQADTLLKREGKDE